MEAFQALSAKLSQIPGLEVRAHEPMAHHTTFRVGGPAALMALPKRLEELSAVLRAAAEAGIVPFFLGKGSNLLVADEDIKPLPVLTGKAGMPENAREKLQAAGASLIPAGPIAEQVATSKSVNVVLLGALATRLDFSEEGWKEVISKRVPPKTVEANLRAFDAGYEFARKGAE